MSHRDLPIPLPLTLPLALTLQACRAGLPEAVLSQREPAIRAAAIRRHLVLLTQTLSLSLTITLTLTLTLTLTVTLHLPLTRTLTLTRCCFCERCCRQPPYQATWLVRWSRAALRRCRRPS